MSLCIILPVPVLVHTWADGKQYREADVLTFSAFFFSPRLSIYDLSTSGFSLNDLV